MQKVFAYCAKSFERSTRKAAAVKPITCPPTFSASLDPKCLENYRLLYFDLHGSRSGLSWHGDNKLVALTARQLEHVSLRGTVVFAVNCYLADSESPMMDALLDAGASLVIGGDGPNWAGAKRQLYGATLLGMWFRRLFLAGVEPMRALTLAKKRVKATLVKDKLIGRKKRWAAAQDTLGFRAYIRRRVI